MAIETMDNETEILNETQTPDQDNDDNTEQTPDSDENPQEAKAKRERVDLASLAPMDKVTVSFQVPAEFKLMLESQGEAKQVSGSALARELVCTALGYTLPDSFIERKRTPGLTEEERKANNAKAAREKQEKIKKLLALYEKGEISTEMLDTVQVEVKTRKRKDSE